MKANLSGVREAPVIRRSRREYRYDHDHGHGPARHTCVAPSLPASGAAASSVAGGTSDRAAVLPRHQCRDRRRPRLAAVGRPGSRCSAGSGQPGVVAACSRRRRRRRGSLRRSGPRRTRGGPRGAQLPGREVGARCGPSAAVCLLSERGVDGAGVRGSGRRCGDDRRRFHLSATDGRFHSPADLGRGRLPSVAICLTVGACPGRLASGQHACLLVPPNDFPRALLRRVRPPTGACLSSV